jgi:hypothetical protein
MNLSAQVSRAKWRPVPPPRRGDRDRLKFYVSMLLPGLSAAFHQTVLNRCYTSVREYRAEADAAADADPELRQLANAAASALTPADGMLMAQLRGECQLQFWSRVAIVEYRKQGYTIPTIAQAFRCSLRTVVNVTCSSIFLSPHRRLTHFQLHPPAKFTPRAERR